jgi:hypothetical protein
LPTRPLKNTIAFQADKNNSTTLDCCTFEILISAAVDRCLSPTQRSRFREHLQLCAPCRQSFEMECAVKHLIHDHLGMVKTPGVIAARILDCLQSETHRLRKDQH